MKSLWTALSLVLASPGAAFGQSVSADTVADIRLQPWRLYIEEASRRFGIPVAWIERVMLAESAGRTAIDGRPITSRAGAMGLMQLMPGTYADMREAYGLGPDPFDPHDNILAGTAYLRQMFERFGYPGLFGAYNAGPDRFAASLTGAALPAETRAYMRKVAAKTRAAPTVAPLFVPVFAPENRPESLPSNALFVVRWTPDTPPISNGDAPARVGPAVTSPLPEVP